MPSYFVIGVVLQHFLMLAVLNAQSWVNPGFVHDSERLHLEKVLNWDELKPASLNLLFDTRKMYGSCTLQLLGYTESMKKLISKTEKPFEILGSIPVSIDNAEGRLDVLNLGFECRLLLGVSSCAKYHIGYFALSCPISNKNASFYSPIVPLGWLVHKYYQEQKWEFWAHSHCMHWHSWEDSAVRSAVRSVACHPLRHYAHASASEYSYINVPYNLSKYAGFTSKTVSPTLAVEPMQECYLSTVDPSAAETKMHASPVAMCCYAAPSTQGANIRWTYMFKEAESSDNYMIHGSSSFRAHPFGVETHDAKFYLPGQVPYLSHWYWDLLPYRYCCLWWKGGACADYYNVARPSPQLRSPAVGYNSAFLLGNLIAKPFEPSKPFMCSGIGEYWLVKSAAFKVQVQTDLVSNSFDRRELLQPKGSSSRSSRSPFVIGLAFQVSSLPHLIFRLRCSLTEYNAYMWVTDTKRGGRSERIDTSSQRFFGHVTISEQSFNDALKTMSFALRHKGEFMGISVYLVYPEHEFMSVMVSAGSKVSATTGLLGNAADAGVAGSSGAAAAGGSGLEYSDLCAGNKVAVDHAENLFKDMPPSSEPGRLTTSSGSDTTEPPTARPPVPARVRRDTSSDTYKLAIAGKGLDNAKEITCLSTTHLKYCTDIEKSSAQIQDSIRRLNEGNPDKGTFRFCTSLPLIRGLKVRIFNTDTGLSPDDTMMLACSHPFRASQQGSSKCSGDGRIVQYKPEVEMTCSLIEDDKKADDKAQEWFNVNNGSSQFDQHLESYHFKQDGKVTGKRGDKGPGQQLVAHGLTILAAVAAAFCITLSNS